MLKTREPPMMTADGRMTDSRKMDGSAVDAETDISRCAGVMIVRANDVFLLKTVRHALIEKVISVWF